MAPIRPRQTQSCLGCRTIKVRCVGNEDQSGRCTRCERLNFSCEYASQRRGRKTNAERALRDSMSSQPTATIDDQVTVQAVSVPTSTQPHVQVPSNSIFSNQMIPSTFLTSSSSSGGTMPAPSSGSLMQTVDDLELLFSHNDPPQSLHQPIDRALITPPNRVEFILPTQGAASSQTQASNNSISSSGRRVNPSAPPHLDVSEYLDPPLPSVSTSNGQYRPPSPTPDTMEDGKSKDQSNPINMGVLSPLEAAQLISLYHLHLNPVLALLDPQLHNLEFLSNSSPVLLTSVLAAACKFFRIDLYSRLVDHAQTLLNRAINTGVCEIALMQSLMILVIWKAPTDRSAWIKIGMAVRLGYQHGLHLPINRILPEDDHKARVILDRERTWFCIVCFDKKSFGLPTAIRPHEVGDAEVWAREHLHLDNPIDMHLAASIQLGGAYDQLERLSLLQKLDGNYWHTVLTDIMADHQRKVENWLGAGQGARFLSDQSKMCLRFLASNISLAIRQRGLEAGLGTNGGITECLAVITETVGQLEGLAQAKILSYMHDVTSCVLSEATMLMYKMFWRLGSEQRHLAVGLIKRIHATCFSVSQGKGDSATAFIARFTQRALISLRAESRVPSPTALGGEATDDTANAFLRDLEELLATNVNHPDTTSEDDQHWLSLFAPNGEGVDFPWFTEQTQ